MNNAFESAASRKARILAANPIEITRSLGQLKRPFYATINGKLFSDPHGNPRRFATDTAARKAATAYITG